MEDTRAVGGVFGTILSAVGTSMSITEVQAIVSIVVTVLGFLITVLTTVIIPVIIKYKKAKKDGKVTIEEVEEIVDTAKEGLDKIKNDSEK